jgi:uncharacterized protein YndB with AHSA1/START domain
MTVNGLTGREITDFLLDCGDDRYQAWWPGTHLELHVLEQGSGGDHVGDVVLMDEYVGSRRVRMVGEVVEAVPGERIVWRFRPGGLRLPVRLILALSNDEHGVRLRHTITAGWSGRGRMLDPLWRLYFSRSFAGAMDRHVRTEFPLMRDMLHRAPTDSTSGPAAVQSSTIG